MHAKCITITKANMQYFEDYMYGILWNTMIRANEFHLNKECLEYLGVDAKRLSNENIRFPWIHSQIVIL